jgi:hypothetical protein
MSSASTLKAIRLTHHYSGVFLAPAILFFAITGGLQMFGLHETSRGSSYVPPAFLVHLSQLHKKGTLFVPPRRPQPAAKPDSPKADASKPDGPKTDQPKQQPFTPPQNPHNPLPIKIFFAITSIGLVVSTLSGLVMAWKYTRRKSLVAGTFLAGILIPILLLFL